MGWGGMAVNAYLRVGLMIRIGSRVRAMMQGNSSWLSVRGRKF